MKLSWVKVQPYLLLYSTTKYSPRCCVWFWLQCFMHLVYVQFLCSQTTVMTIPIDNFFQTCRAQCCTQQEHRHQQSYDSMQTFHLFCSFRLIPFHLNFSNTHKSTGKYTVCSSAQIQHHTTYMAYRYVYVAAYCSSRWSLQHRFILWPVERRNEQMTKVQYNQKYWQFLNVHGDLNPIPNML